MTSNTHLLLLSRSTARTLRASASRAVSFLEDRATPLVRMTPLALLGAMLSPVIPLTYALVLGLLAFGTRLSGRTRRAWRGPCLQVAPSAAFCFLVGLAAVRSAGEVTGFVLLIGSLALLTGTACAFLTLEAALPVEVMGQAAPREERSHSDRPPLERPSPAAHKNHPGLHDQASAPGPTTAVSREWIVTLADSIAAELRPRLPVPPAAAPVAAPVIGSLANPKHDARTKRRLSASKRAKKRRSRKPRASASVAPSLSKEGAESAPAVLTQEAPAPEPTSSALSTTPGKDRSSARVANRVTILTPDWTPSPDFAKTKELCGLFRPQRKLLLPTASLEPAPLEELLELSSREWSASPDRMPIPRERPRSRRERG